MYSGVANTIDMSNFSRKGYAQPILPKTKINTSPAIIGEIENGISISVVSICFIRNLYFVTAHEAKIPKEY